MQRRNRAPQAVPISGITPPMVRRSQQDMDRLSAWLALVLIVAFVVFVAVVIGGRV